MATADDSTAAVDVEVECFRVCPCPPLVRASLSAWCRVRLSASARRYNSWTRRLLRGGGFCRLWLRLYLQFPRLRQQFFQLAFDGGVADVLVLQYAFGVNREGVRNSLDAEEL